MHREEGEETSWKRPVRFVRSALCYLSQQSGSLRCDLSKPEAALEQ